MDPVRILKEIIEYLNEHPVAGEHLVTFEDPEGTEGDAEARISWGGNDLFDIRIERV
jgi:hypothetical protein